MVAGTAATALLFLACVGVGAAVLRLLGILDDMHRRERLPWSFALGMGLLGWITFFPAAFGFIAPLHLVILCLACTGGLYFIVRAGFLPKYISKLDRNGWILCATVAVALAFDLLEGISPPADTDSLAYHFALPKQFLAAGRLEFVPRAADGAAPMLLHMTYLIALGMGGETGLTIWTMVSGWMPSLLIFVICRRFLDFNWSLSAALIFLTTPAVLYGAGSGQMETRLALFVLCAVFAAGQAMRGGKIQYVVLAAMFAGFFGGAKYTGLIFMAACGLALLLGRRRITQGAVFGVVALVAGAQWYFWNWLHTGDPLFPLLFSRLGTIDGTLWNAAQDEYFRASYFGSEAPLSRSPLNLMIYPFLATLNGNYVFESSRTGLGPYGLLILPFALAGLWKMRRRILTSELAIPVLVVALFYVIWFYTGSSQRIRHLLPVYPVLLIGMTVAAQRWVAYSAFSKPAGAVIILVALTQIAGQGVFATNYIRYVFSSESREAFLRRTVLHYEAMAWINQNLTRNHKVLITDRQLVYLANIPVYYSHMAMEAVVENYPKSSDPVKFYNQIRKLKITHLLVSGGNFASGDKASTSGYQALRSKLLRARCMETVKTLYISAGSSRTLPTLNRSSTQMTIFALRPKLCRL